MLSYGTYVYTGPIYSIYRRTLRGRATPLYQRGSARGVGLIAARGRPSATCDVWRTQLEDLSDAYSSKPKQGWAMNLGRTHNVVSSLDGWWTTFNQPFKCVEVTIINDRNVKRYHGNVEQRSTLCITQNISIYDWTVSSTTGTVWCRLSNEW